MGAQYVNAQTACSVSYMLLLGVSRKNAMALILASMTALGVAEMALNAHRDAMQDTAVLMLAYITLHEKLQLGGTDRHMALNWWSLGWVTRESLHPERW